jgi:hypothetical protein
MRLLNNQEDMRDQISAMNRFGQSPFTTPVTLPTSPNFPLPATGLTKSYKNVLASEDPTERMRNAGFSAGGKTEAKAVQNQGRGNDTMLVHMTPGEVAGLQALAMQHGGSLTINPETGLAEAGFLKSILPTLIGAGLMMVPGMQGYGAGMIGAGVGALEFARTGDLGKGLMAGLGAYGGAGLVGGLQAAGATGNLTAEQAAQRATQASMVSPAPSITSTNAFSPVASTAAPTPLQIAMAGGTSPATTIGGNLAQTGAGISNLGTEAGRKAFMTAAGGGKGLAMQAGAALAGPAMEPAPMPTVTQPEYNYKGPYKPTKREVVYPGEDRDPNDSSEFLYFPNINPVPYAEGGTSVATAPPEGYVPGQDGEFVYGFTPMSTDMPVVQETARASRGIDAIAPAPDAIRTASITVSGGDGGDDNTGPGVSVNNINRSKDYGYDYPSYSEPTRKEEQAERAAAAAAIAGELMAKGGEVNMHNNGFVVDAHTVSEVGNGSSNAGIERFMAIGGRPIMGPGDGTSDSIPANIDGMQPAMVARDEVYMPPPAVAAYGNGSLKVGEKKLYKLMEKAHASRKKNGRGQSTGLKQLVS